MDIPLKPHQKGSINKIDRMEVFRKRDLLKNNLETENVGMQSSHHPQSPLTAPALRQHLCPSNLSNGTYFCAYFSKLGSSQERKESECFNSSLQTQRNLHQPPGHVLFPSFRSRCVIWLEKLGRWVGGKCSRTFAVPGDGRELVASPNDNLLRLPC